MIKRVIKLANGAVLEMEMEQEFLEHIRKFYNLSDIASVSNQHIKHFVLKATNDAVTKAEKQLLATG